MIEEEIKVLIHQEPPIILQQYRLKMAGYFGHAALNITP